MTSQWKISAAKELELDSNLKELDLKNIREWLKTKDNLPTIDDEMILHFLHACYYKPEMAKITIDHFYLYKTTMPDFFENWDPSGQEVQDIVNRVLITAPLPSCNAEGYKVIVCKLNDTDTKKFNFALCVKWLIMSSLHVIWNQGIQKGYVLVYDADGFTFSHALKCSLHHSKNYINFGKNASPIRVIKIAFINTSSVIEKLISIVKPFLNKDLLNMMSFHTSAETFFKDMPKENVPEDYGGTAPALLSLHQTYAEEIALSKEWLLKEEKVKGGNINKLKKDVPNLHNPLNKLEID